MNTQKLLLVITADVDPSVARAVIDRYTADGDRIKVVATADVSLLDWLATDERGARAEAANRAEHVASSVRHGRDAEASVGDPDPLQAIEDALALFSADEIVLISRPEPDAHWLEQRAFSEKLEQEFELPVRHHLVPDPEAPKDD